MYSTANDPIIKKNRIIDLRSDTVSVPTEKMRKAMSEAVVGDDVYREDPTVVELEKRTAELFGKEAAIFTPSGTMANLISIMIHCNERGCEAVTGDLQHTFLYEQAGAAQIAGVQLSTIPNQTNGTFCLNALRKKIRGFDIHEPKTKLVMVENTHNMCGGKALPLEWIDELAEICRANKLKLHMDGARIFNAAEYLKVPLSRIVRDVDSVCFCLSKGLSCPVGSLLIGNSKFIEEARRFRKVLGGGMRQVGILAAAGLVALDEIVPRLGEDHLKIKKIAQALHNLNSPTFKIDIDNVQTNILMIQLVNASFKSEDFASRLTKITEAELNNGIVDKSGKGIAVILSSRDWSFARLLIYTQITDEEIELAIKKLVYVIREYDQMY